MVRVRLESGDVAVVELLKGLDSVVDVCEGLQLVGVDAPKTLLAVSPDMQVIEEEDSAACVLDLLQRGATLFESRPQMMARLQRARKRFFPGVVERGDAPPQKKVLEVQVNDDDGTPLKVLLTEDDTGAAMVAKIQRKRRVDETVPGSLVVGEDHYVGPEELLWPLASAAGAVARFVCPAEDTRIEVTVAHLVAEGAAPPLSTVRYLCTDDVLALFRRCKGVPAGSSAVLLVRDLPDRLLDTTDNVFEAVCMYHPSTVVVGIVPGRKTAPPAAPDSRKNTGPSKPSVNVDWLLEDSVIEPVADPFE